MTIEELKQKAISQAKAHRGYGWVKMPWTSLRLSYEEWAIYNTAYNEAYDNYPG